jgi:hypothetical protein
VNQEEAIKILNNKKWITNALRRYSAVLRALPNDVSKAYNYFGEPENVVALIKPPSYLEVVSELPPGPILQEQLQNVIKVITRLNYEDFTIESDRNPITKENDYTQFYVHLPSKSLVDLVYHSQPFFGSIIAHKITHLSVCHYLRYGREICMMCDNDKVKFIR